MTTCERWSGISRWRSTWLGNCREAEAMQRAAVALEDRLHGSALTAGMAHEALALTLVAESKADSAEVYEREALRLFRAGAAPEHWRIWSAQRNLAIIAAARGRVDEGLALLDSAIAAATAGPDSKESAGYLIAQRVPFLIRLKRLTDASRSIAVAERQLGASAAVTPSHRADVNRYAGMVDLANGDAARAVRRFRVGRIAHRAAGRYGDRFRGINSCLLGRCARARSAAAKKRVHCSTSRARRIRREDCRIRWS